VLFPKGSRPLVIYEPRYRAMVADALRGDRIIGMVSLQPGHEAEYDGRPPIHAVGCAGRISEVEHLPDGRYALVLRGVTRFRVLSEDHSRPYRLGRVQAIPEAARIGDGSALRADRKRLDAIASTQGIEVSVLTSNDEEAIDALAQYVEMPPERRQELLEMDGAPPRARALLDLLVAR
jgi:Lon protease-like protein